MLLSNPFRPDPRVYEEAKALTEEGHRVTLIAWDREMKYPEEEEIDGIKVLRVRVPSGYGKFSEFLPGLLRFYFKARKIARNLEFEAVHSHDFDTLPLGIWIAANRVPVIYDVHDDYASMISESVPGFLAELVELQQKVLIRLVNHVVYANEALKRLIGEEGTVVMNCKDPEDYEISQEEVKKLKKKLGVDGFVIVYIGIFRQIEFLRTLIEAVKRSGVYLVLGGDGPYRDEVLDRIRGERRIKYVGWIHSKDIPSYTKLADAIVVLNDPRKRYDRLSTPVKMFEAMAAGVPVIVARGGEAERIVDEEKCGLAINFGDVDALVSALEKLKDEKFRKKLGENGLNAARRKYNRNVQKMKLIRLYASLGFSVH